MSEELEALQEVRQQLIYYKEYAKEKLPTKVKQIDDSCEEELNLIETALKNYEELTNKPVVLYGRTQAIIDTICKTHKEIKVINLIDKRKVKAFDTIKEKQVDVYILLKTKSLDEYNEWYVGIQDDFMPLTQDEYELLREVLL